MGSTGFDARRLGEHFLSRAERIRGIRRDLHRIPELGFSETRTSALIRRELDALGLAYESGVGGTGVVARVGPAGGNRMALRADIDALPIEEQNEVEYKSTAAGLMHACGHDAHAAMLLGAAEYLKSIEPELPGQVLLAFQPSEERSDGHGLSGAGHVLRSGLLAGCRAVVGLHVMNDLPPGRFAILDGPVLASGDLFEATISGRGGHDSRPDILVDPIYLATRVLDCVYSIRSRKVHPSQAGTISVGVVEGGTTANVIPGSVRLGGTIRTFDDGARAAFLAGLEEALGVARALGGDYELKLPFRVPATRNDPAVAAIARGACVELFGEGSLIACEPAFGVEDFSWYGSEFPALFVLLGADPGEGRTRPPHNSRFDIDDGILYRGSALLAATALGVLAS